MTSDLLGQATCRSSERTSRRNCPGRKGSRFGGPPGRRGGALGRGLTLGVLPLALHHSLLFSVHVRLPSTVATGGEQGRRDLNPQPSVLETGALPVELLPSADRHAASGPADRRGGPSGYHRGHRNSQASHGLGAWSLPTGRRRWTRPTRRPPGPSRGRSRRARLGRSLSGLLVQGVLAVPAAELLHLDPLAVVDLVLRGDVVTSLALLACQGDLDALLVLCHGDSSCTLPPRPATDSSDACPVL